MTTLAMDMDIVAHRDDANTLVTRAIDVLDAKALECFAPVMPTMAASGGRGL